MIGGSFGGGWGSGSLAVAVGFGVGGSIPAAQLTEGPAPLACGIARYIASFIQYDTLSSSATARAPTIDRRRSAVAAPVEGDKAGTSTRIQPSKATTEIVANPEVKASVSARLLPPAYLLFVLCILTHGESQRRAPLAA